MNVPLVNKLSNSDTLPGGKISPVKNKTSGRKRSLARFDCGQPAGRKSLSMISWYFLLLFLTKAAYTLRKSVLISTGCSRQIATPLPRPCCIGVPRRVGLYQRPLQAAPDQRPDRFISPSIQAPNGFTALTPADFRNKHPPLDNPKAATMVAAGRVVFVSCRKESAMSAIPKPENHFLIDLGGQQAFCRLCRKPCRSLVLPRFTLFWCTTRSCENTAEAHLYPSGRWAICALEEIWEEESTSAESLSKLKIREVFSINSDWQVPEPLS